MIEISPCENGGIVACIHEHGTDAGSGDNKFRAGWGNGHATLKGTGLHET